MIQWIQSKFFALFHKNTNLKELMLTNKFNLKLSLSKLFERILIDVDDDDNDDNDQLVLE